MRSVKSQFLAQKHSGMNIFLQSEPKDCDNYNYMSASDKLFLYYAIYYSCKKHVSSFTLIKSLECVYISDIT